MNEVDELLKLEPGDLPPVKGLALDDLHQKVRKNMYLELGTGAVLFLLSPSYSVLHPTPNDTIGDLVRRKETVLDHVKDAIIQSLAAYSALLEVNSYFVEQNSFLLLARLREKDSGGRRYEIKFYTHAPLEILSRYEDKIYIGRDFLDLFHFQRKYFGIRDLIASLKDQAEKLVDKGEEKLRKPADYKAFFQEIKESVGELNSESQALLESLPPVVDFAKMGEQELIDVNAQYRAINHYLIELNDEVGEFENLLRFRMEIDFVRYVTKYKKDITNLISYFNIKINGSLGDRILHPRHK